MPPKRRIQQNDVPSSPAKHTRSNDPPDSPALRTRSRHDAEVTVIEVRPPTKRNSKPSGVVVKKEAVAAVKRKLTVGSSATKRTRKRLSLGKHIKDVQRAFLGDSHVDDEISESEYDYDDEESDDSSGRQHQQNRLESNRHAQDGKMDPQNDDVGENDDDDYDDEDGRVGMVDMDDDRSDDEGDDDRGRDVPAKPMTFELPTAEKNVEQRIVQYVKNTMFRKIKFLSSAQFPRAFHNILLSEKPRDPYVFKLVYAKCFNHAMNQKRSTCEQAAGKIVVQAINSILEFKSGDEEFWSLEELCKLRRAKTNREMQAFKWFFGDYIESISGAHTWRSKQTKELISKAKNVDGSVIVSKSDEAFGLLLLENYFEKWKQLAEKEAALKAGIAWEEPELAVGRKKRKVPGRYTKKGPGHCKFGGWSQEGIERYNQLRRLVKEDRESEDAPVSEALFLQYCRERSGVGDDDINGNNDGVKRKTATRELVEPEWDSDAED